MASNVTKQAPVNDSGDNHTYGSGTPKAFAFTACSDRWNQKGADECPCRPDRADRYPPLSKIRLRYCHSRNFP